MRKITVGMLLYPGFQMLDIAGLGDAFSEVDILSGDNFKYELVSVTADVSAQSVMACSHLPPPACSMEKQ
jgi:hypothetical protein